MSWLLTAIGGLIIGAIARLLLPGKQPMAWWMTMLLGVVSVLLAKAIFENMFDGFLLFIAEVVVAMGVIFVADKFIGQKK